jgi:hypothetical protein
MRRLIASLVGAWSSTIKILGRFGRVVLIGLVAADNIFALAFGPPRILAD